MLHNIIIETSRHIDGVIHKIESVVNKRIVSSLKSISNKIHCDFFNSSKTKYNSAKSAVGIFENITNDYNNKEKKEKKVFIYENKFTYNKFLNKVNCDNIDFTKKIKLGIEIHNSPFLTIKQKNELLSMIRNYSYNNLTEQQGEEKNKPIKKQNESIIGGYKELQRRMINTVIIQIQESGVVE